MLLTPNSLLQTLLAVVVFAGCYPSPHFETRSPSIAGVVRDSERELPGRLIALSVRSQDSNCTQPAATSRTDERGRFEFESTRDFAFSWFLMAEYFYPFHVCLISDDPPVLLWSGSLDYLEISKHPYRLQLECEMTAPSGRRGLCEGVSSTD